MFPVCHHLNLAVCDRANRMLLYWLGLVLQSQVMLEVCAKRCGRGGNGEKNGVGEERIPWTCKWRCKWHRTCLFAAASCSLGFCWHAHGCSLSHWARQDLFAPLFESFRPRRIESSVVFVSGKGAAAKGERMTDTNSPSTALALLSYPVLGERVESPPWAVVIPLEE